MTKCITEKQKAEIVELSKNHRDSLIAFGADMYRSGLIEGAISTVLGVIVINCTIVFVKKIKEKSEQKRTES